MAQDRSVIKVPAIKNTTITPKVDAKPIEELIFNNGILIPKSSLTKVLPLSLAKVFKNGNKIYLFDRDTTLIEKYIRDQINDGDVEVEYTTSGYTGDRMVNFLSADFLAFTVRDAIVLGYGVAAEYNNDSEEKISKALSSPFVSSNTFDISENLENKTLKLNNLKQTIIQKYLLENYLPYVGDEFPPPNPEKLVIKNFFLRLKSYFSNNEIIQNYDKIVYLLSKWIFPKISDPSTFDDIAIENKKIKSKLLGSLTYNDFDYSNEKTIKIISSTNINVNYVSLTNNVNIHDVTGFTVIDPTTNPNVSRQYLMLSTRYSYIYFTRPGDVLIFVNRYDNSVLFAIKVIAIGDLLDFIDGEKNVENVTFSYEPLPLYNIPSAVRGFRNYSSTFEFSTLNDNLFDLYIMDYDKYKGFLAYNTNVLELEIDESTTFEGQFYGIEIE